MVMGGWVGGWVDVKYVIRIAYRYQKMRKKMNRNPIAKKTDAWNYETGEAKSKELKEKTKS